jgi:peptidoglycan hydrolase-like protein with peptidoglycan-binding domain
VVGEFGFKIFTKLFGDTSSNPIVFTPYLNAAGYFSWTPTNADRGEHTITVYASDALGHNASKSVTLTVGTGATLSVILLSPGSTVSPGQPVTFTVAPNEFLPTGFSLKDSFANSSINNTHISLSGQFSWVPSQSDIGVHTIHITGVVGVYGKSASTTQTITVLGPGGVVPTPVASVATSTAGNDTLAALQAKLASLQSSLTSAQSSGTTAVSSAALFTTYLKPGSSGEEVLRLQKVLAQLGHLSATPNGTYGPATTAAVQAFQKAKGLDMLGVVGPGTRAALNALGTTVSTPATSTASTGTRFVFTHFMGVGDDDAEQVIELQKRLTELGFYTGTQSGYFGSETEAAVKRFQKAKGIPETGYVARITRAALNQ